jgi:hypothetical protein
LVAQVGFLVVAGKRLRCYFLTYHTSCAVVSVFWLRREIVFFTQSYSSKDLKCVVVVVRRCPPYLLSSHVSRLVHRSTTFYSTYITFFTIHFYVFTVQVLFTDYNAK